jgi:hypothetical protein
MHSCSICNYLTTSHHNFKKHLKTKKHLNLVKQLTPPPVRDVINFTCTYCSRMYSYKSNLNRHLKTCKKHEIHNKDIKATDEIQLEIEKLKCQYLELELKIRKTHITRNTKNNLYQIGLEYEKYVLETVKNNYKSCYRWNDIPINILSSKFYNNNKICDDIGCDIIGINHDNTIDYIQCKKYSTTIKISDLSGFYNFVSENYISNAIVYYTGKLSRQVLLRKYNIQYRNLPCDIVSSNKKLTIDSNQ